MGPPQAAGACGVHAEEALARPPCDAWALLALRHAVRATGCAACATARPLPDQGGPLATRAAAAASGSATAEPPRPLVPRRRLGLHESAVGAVAQGSRLSLGGAGGGWRRGEVRRDRAIVSRGHGCAWSRPAVARGVAYASLRWRPSATGGGWGGACARGRTCGRQRRARAPGGGTAECHLTTWSKGECAVGECTRW